METLDTTGAMQAQAAWITPVTSSLPAYPPTHYRTTPLPYTPLQELHMNNTTTTNTGFSMFSKLPTTEYLYARNPALRDSKNVISLAHFAKVYMALPVSDFQHQRLMALCHEYNTLTREQQVAQNEPHLSAEDDFAVFTDKDGYCIIQHDPTYTTFKVLGFESVEMTKRTML